MLRSLVGAYTTHACNSSHDDAIKCLLKVANMRNSRNPATSPSLWPASIELTSALTTPFNSNTNPKLYDRFIALTNAALTEPISSMKGRLVILHFRIAQLCVWHPTEPSAANAVRLLQAYIAHGSDDGTVIPPLSNARMRPSFSRFLEKTIVVLESQGHHETVAWIRKHFSEFLDAKKGDKAGQTVAKDATVTVRYLTSADSKPQVLR